MFEAVLIYIDIIIGIGVLIILCNRLILWPEAELPNWDTEGRKLLKTTFDEVWFLACRKKQISCKKPKAVTLQNYRLQYNSLAEAHQKYIIFMRAFLTVKTAQDRQFVIGHEIGHIVLGHVDIPDKLKDKELCEREAYLFSASLFDNGLELLRNEMHRIDERRRLRLYRLSFGRYFVGGIYKKALRRAISIMATQ
ncbi:MAG: ImmA/IrrE family metallo-endopeptidase [Patescibacteria group bacterium]|nr:ImmA/IrrE family metallo-endopeptidase [Patescibacteria group bacterium]MDE2015623.1 ImmA/IrrE family metallo-endopeptidase [Patescibacteria group bacterium]MDE2226680.1 ImmA/IrrE family metallo-endopeptidase [Patescibacteria group bacterium]